MHASARIESFRSQILDDRQPAANRRPGPSNVATIFLGPCCTALPRKLSMSSQSRCDSVREDKSGSSTTRTVERTRFTAYAGGAPATKSFMRLVRTIECVGEPDQVIGGVELAERCPGYVVCDVPCDLDGCSDVTSSVQHQRRGTHHRVARDGRRWRTRFGGRQWPKPRLAGRSAEYRPNCSRATGSSPALGHQRLSAEPEPHPASSRSMPSFNASGARPNS